ncbi:formin-like 2 domain-containing protein [Aureococcus anophagefferens]|nr:formin-like 2 domain-containing protein [Aureococcus anophagefferens]
MAPSATPGGSPGASASSTSSQSAAPPSPLKAARRPAPFSTSFLSLVSATLGGPSVDEFGVGARVWVAHADGSATSATVLAAPQPRSGRCVVREDGRAPAQYHAAALRRAGRRGDARASGARRGRPVPAAVRVRGRRAAAVRRREPAERPGPVRRPASLGYGRRGPRGRLAHAGQLELVDGSFLDDVSRELAPGLLFGECRAYPEAAAKDAADATEDCKEAPPPRYAPADDPDYGPYYRMLKVGAPPAAIAQKMARDGRDARRIEATEPFFVEGSGGAPAAAAGAPGGSVAALFGGGGGGLPAPKRAPKRRLTVKQLPLDFHAAVGEDSIWADVHALNGIEVHRPELEKLFVKATADKKDAPKARKAVKKVKDGARVVVLNPKRSTNVAIALSGSKLTALAPAVVAAALERLDAAAFTRTQLDALDAAAPQADEVASLEKCAAGDDDFGRYAEAERFMCRVALPMGARLYADRVAALRYRGGFDDRAAALRGAASRLRAGCAEVTASPSLKKLLTYVLRLSSELADAKRFEFGSPGGAGAGGGDDRAGAAGFKMASLLKLADTKAFDRETSALESSRV